MPPEPRDAFIKDAKQYVRDIVRNDWSFEPPSPQPQQQSPLPAQVLKWRLREYDSSGSELEPPTGTYQVVDMLNPTAPVKAAAKKQSDASPAVQPSGGVRVGQEGEEEDLAKVRRKRRRRMEEEMGWNEGLRTWVLRRDAWSGARTRWELHGGDGGREKQSGRKNKKKKGLITQLKGSGASENAEETTRPVDIQKDSDKDAAPSPGSIPSWSSSSSPSRVHLHGNNSTLVERTATSTLVAKTATTVSSAQRHQQVQQPTLEGNTMRKESTETAITEPDRDNLDHSTKEQEEDSSGYDSDSDSESDEEDPNESLVPVVPPLLSPSNPIRSSITPAIYPSIYTKVIVQGLTPTIPINLADLTKAMVQGWKADGQWPPKPSTPAPGDNVHSTRRKKSESNATTATKGSSTLGGASSGARPDSSSAQLHDTGAGGGSSGHTRRRSSVANAVRKVLHFSGIHSHPFHRRGSTHESATGDRAGAAGSVAIVDEPER